MLNSSQFKQTDSVNLRGQGFKCWLWVFLLSILLLFTSCGLFGDDVIDSGVDIGSLGFVNDTTAIIFKRYWEQTESRCGFEGYCDGISYTGSEMQLSDIRFDKAYWTKKIVPDDKGMTFIDSTLFFFGVGNADNISGKADNYYVSQITVHRLGDAKFQQAKKIELKFKNIELRGEGWYFSENIRIRPWHGGLILANRKYPVSIDGNGNYVTWDTDNHYALIDSTSGTFELFTPPPPSLNG